MKRVVVLAFIVAFVFCIPTGVLAKEAGRDTQTEEVELVMASPDSPDSSAGSTDFTSAPKTSTPGTGDNAPSLVRACFAFGAITLCVAGLMANTSEGAKA